MNTQHLKLLEMIKCSNARGLVQYLVSYKRAQ